MNIHIQTNIKVYLLFNTAKEIEKKLRNICTQYTREKQKTKKTKSGDGADDIYESKWPHFKCLQFLDEFVTAKNSRSNLRKVRTCMSILCIHNCLNHLVLPCNCTLVRIEIVT